MLPVYIEGSDVVVTQTLPVKSGVAIVPTSVEYAVFDETGASITVRTSVPGYAAGDIVLEVPFSANILQSDKNRGLRTVEFYINTAGDGEFKTRQRYILQNYEVLDLPVNSFQSLEQAFLVAAEIPELVGWNAAEENQKIAAMITAHQQICRLSFRFYKDDGVQLDYSYRANPNDYTYVPRMRLITLSDWNQFPSRFQNALQRAQLFEADTMLAGDPVRDKRLNGIISETVGESKMFFNNRPPISMPVSRKSLEALAGYFYYNNRIART